MKIEIRITVEGEEVTDNDVEYLTQAIESEILLIKDAHPTDSIMDVYVDGRHVVKGLTS